MRSVLALVNISVKDLNEYRFSLLLKVVNDMRLKGVTSYDIAFQLVTLAT